MELRHLKYFVAVAEEAHFGRAAQRMHIVQPALSMQIKALEEELGGALFTRTSRQVKLTVAGEVFLVQARRALMQADYAKELVQSSLRGETGSVRIGFVGNAVLTGKLASDLRMFHRSSPSAAITLHEIPPHAQSAALLAHEIDVGYIPKGFPIPEELQGHAVFSSPFVAVMAEDHPLSSNTFLTLQSLQQETLILLGRELNHGPLEHLNQLGFAPRAILRVSSTLSVLATAAAGMGVALVPAAIERLQIPHLVYREIEGLTKIATLMVLHRASETSGAVNAFLNIANS